MIINFIEKISDIVSRYMALIMLVVAAVSLLLPGSALWIQTSWINYFLMIIMFGMGLMLKPQDFAIVFSRPRDILLGCAAQFTVMPLLAFVLSRLLALDDALTVGVVLVGTCPGGTASNVITYFAKGDVAFSVGMTSINTLLAPLITPAITYLLLQTNVTVDIYGMFFSIVTVVVIPIVLGFVINKLFNRLTQKIVSLLPVISTISICMAVASIVSHNSDRIFTSGYVILAVVIFHNLLGLLCGFGLGKLLKMSPDKIKALSIEIGMQNSGLAASIAGTEFSQLQMATVPGAIFSVWHNISGAILAGIYRKWGEETKDTVIKEERT